MCDVAKVAEWCRCECCEDYGHVDVAKVLIQNGADVNAVDERKETALHSQL